MRLIWYALVIIALLAMFAVALFVELRTSKEEEAKRIAGLDKDMAKVKDDQNEMARFVP